jgi:hypothetical protein
VKSGLLPVSARQRPEVALEFQRFRRNLGPRGSGRESGNSCGPPKDSPGLRRSFQQAC